MSQAKIFLKGEGDEWFERNKHTDINHRVCDAILNVGYKPSSILELGCGNGRYIGELHRHFGGQACGVDPSTKAINEARKNYPNIRFRIDTAAEAINYECRNHAEYDLVFFGFCLYLIDREDLFYIVAGTDALLKDGGHIAIYDFDTSVPRRVPYKYIEGVFSYKMDHSILWLANPAYRLVSRIILRGGESVTIICKTGWGNL